MRATDAYALWRRVRDAGFSRLARRDFAAFGVRTVVRLPVRLGGVERIHLGDDVVVEAGSWFEALAGGEIHIGDRTTFAGPTQLSAAARIVIGEDVLFARNVHVVDHNHASGDRTLPVSDQGISDVAPVWIGDGAWIGAGATILPGVSIGRNAVIGAGAVVTRDVPDFAVAVGVPARVVTP